jgi:hypothetical protein
LWALALINLYLLASTTAMKSQLHRYEVAASPARKLEARVEANRAEIAALGDRLARPTAASDRPFRSAEERADPSAARYDALLSRIEKLEATVGNWSDRGTGKGDAALTSRPLQVSAVSGSIEKSAYRPNSMGDEAFLADSGKPLGDYPERLADVFNAAGDLIEVRDMECRESICRVTFAPSHDNASGMGQDNDYMFSLVDRLTDSLPGVDLVLRHATNAQGNEVIYIQIR